MYTYQNVTGLPTRKTMAMFAAATFTILGAPFVPKAVTATVSGIQALRSTPGLLAAKTVPVEALITKSGLVLSTGLAIHAIHPEMQAKTIGDVLLYENTSTATDVAVQTLTDGSTRVLNIMKSADAASTFTYTLPLQTGQRASVTPGGAVAIRDTAGKVVTSIPAPWAMDADQNPVPAAYSVNGSTLTLNVDHKSVSAYPVVADPCWSCIFKTAVAAVTTVAAVVSLPATWPVAAVLATDFAIGYTGGCAIANAWGRTGC